MNGRFGYGERANRDRGDNPSFNCPGTMEHVSAVKLWLISVQTSWTPIRKWI